MMIKTLLLMLTFIPLKCYCIFDAAQQDQNPTIKNNAFCRELSYNYMNYSKERAAQYDWKEAKYFTKKSADAASCKMVELETLRDCTAHKTCTTISPLTAEAREVKKIMKDNLLTEQIKQTEPKLASDLQLAYDKWISQQPKQHTVKIAAEHRAEFYKLATLLADKTNQKLPSIIARAQSASSIPINIVFDNASKNLRKDAKILLNKVKDRTNEENCKIVLIGHADEQMEADCNQEISKNRTKEVTKYLVSKGVNADKIITTAMSNNIPVTLREAERERNRRLEIFVITVNQNN